MVQVDLHVHVAGHGLAPMVRAARRAGLKVLGVAEHVFQFRGGRELVPGPALEGPLMEVGDYVARVRLAGGDDLAVRLGIEVDYRSGLELRLAEFLKPWPWDYVLGSVHDVDGRDIALVPDGDWPSHWAGYWRLLEGAAGCRLFDAVSHPLRLAALQPYRPADLAERLAALAELAAARGVALELNTDDLMVIPELQKTLLAACARAGTGVVVGSDAHHPRRVARAFGEAARALAAAGIGEVTAFSARRPEAVPLG